MGSCASAKRKEYEFLGDSEPQDVESWKLPNLPSIPFEIRMSNVKLKNVPYEYAAVVVSIPGCIETKLQRKKGPNNVKWTFDSQVRVKLTEYELRKKFVFISVFQATTGQVKVAELKLNLFLIATGPYHQDFPIRYTNKCEGRMSIDIRVTEVVDIHMESKLASVTLLEDRRDEGFKYTLKSVVNEQLTQSSTFKDAESQASYSEKIAAVSNKQMEEAFPKSKARVSAAHDEIRRELTWNKQGATKRGGPLPTVNTTMLGSDMPNACMQFLLWVVRAQGPHEEEQAAKMLLVGQCYVSYNKLLFSQPKLVAKNGREYEVHLVDVKEKMWYHGKYIGDLQLEISIEIPRFHRQMVVYVRTELGTVKSSPVIISNDRISECLELQELILSKDNIQQQMNELAAMEQMGIKDNKIRQLRTRIRFELKKQMESLETSRKESSMMYNYRSEEEIIKAQEVFIDIGFRLLTIVEEDDTEFRDIAFRCLVALMKRGELTLAYMGFKPEQKQTVKQGSRSKYLQEKFETALKFQTFLYQILRNVLTFLNQKALEQNERMFVELFCAYSYFRVPEFRERLLSILVKADDPDITEWRGTEFSLNDDPSKIDRKGSNTFNLLFDWQSNFYDVLDSDERCRQNLSELSEILDKQEWRHRMQKRGIGFFFFITYWIKYVEKIAILSDNVKWQDLPGYPQLLRAILCQMKRRPIIDYPDSLVDATVSLLANEKLLNTFITVLFNKTNIFDSNTTLRTIELVSRYFMELDKAKRSIPTSFNYNFFVSGLKNIIMSDHSYAIAKCLLLYYDHYNMLNYFVRKDLNMFLMGRAFFRLFLNWSLNVRTIFHHLIVFRVYLQCNIVKKDSMVQQEYLDNEEFKSRYSLLLSVLENAKNCKEEDQNMKFGYNYEKEYYKKMRKKMQDQRRMGNRNPHHQHQFEKDHQNNSRYKLAELVKAPNSRARSEAVSVKVCYDKPPSSQTDLTSVVVKYHEGIEESKERVVTSSRNFLKRLTSHESDCTIVAYSVEIAEIDPRAVEYLTRALSEFRDAEDKYEKFFSKNSAKDPVPAVTVKVPIDEVELRPFHIDEW